MVSFNRNFSVTRVVKKICYTILALYVGGTVIDVFGDVMNNTASAFYQGLELIGWTVGYDATVAGACSGLATTDTTTICHTTGSGVLAVIGIIAIASVVMEFISFR